MQRLSTAAGLSGAERKLTPTVAHLPVANIVSTAGAWRSNFVEEQKQQAVSPTNSTLHSEILAVAVSSKAFDGLVSLSCRNALEEAE